MNDNFKSKFLVLFSFSVMAVLIIFSQSSCLLMLSKKVLAPPSAVPQAVEIVFNSNIPKEQQASLFILPGRFEVTRFNNGGVRWYQPSLRQGGMDVKIPAGHHSLRFNYYGGEGVGNANNVNLNFNAVAGRNYFLFNDFINRGRIMFEILEISQKREPESNEQLLVINYLSIPIRSPASEQNALCIILNKDTDNERKFRYIWEPDWRNSELRIIVPQGIEHTIDVELTSAHITRPLSASQIESSAESQRNFIASSEPIKYSLNYSVTGSGSTRKYIYVLTRD